MQLCRLDVRRRRIGAHDRGTKARQRLAQNAAAAADVEYPQARKRVEAPLLAAEMPACGLLDESEPHRVEPVQHGHLAAWIPPLGRARGKPHHLRLVDG